MQQQIFTIMIITLLSSLFSLNAQEWYTDMQLAQEQAKKLDRPIVLVFQGSDWCIPCMKLEKNIWLSETFLNFAEENYVLLKADFPKKRKNKLSEEQQSKNEKLFEKYNTIGSFPFVVILNKNGKILGTTGYKEVTPKEYLKVLNSLIPVHIHKNKIYKKQIKLMGSAFSITVSTTSQDLADTYHNLAIAEISRIEKMISSWDQTSQTSLINQNAGIKPVRVDPELFNLIKRSIAISRLTDGAFDISYASMDRIWKFDGSMHTFPAEANIKASVAKVGYENIILDEKHSTVFLKHKGMKIGFGGIGKGYAADKAKELLVTKGVKAGIINASGDMNTWGKQPDGSDWQVAITNPMNKKKAFAILPLDNRAIVTSGNYEKFVIFDNKRYSHIIDPRTGYPASGIISATVLADKAELADALATSIFVMGLEAGIDRINQLPNIECIVIDDHGKVYQSNNVRINQ